MRRALGFLTPLGGASVPDHRTLGWFPVVGAAIGLALGAVWWGAERIWPAAVAAAVVIAADLALTGLLHVDGLADSADGLLPQVPRARRLEIMADPAVGAYGVAIVGVTLLLRVTSLAALPPDALLLAAIWCASRTSMAVAARALPYAREEGLATALLGDGWRPVAVGGIAAAGLLGGLAGGAAGVLAVACGLAASALVVLFGRHRLGGFTGDVLGAAGVVGETVALLAAVAAW
jgi:adenosylcobinamide-GDP ribazoletransferase